MNKKQRKICDDLGWVLREDGNYVDVCQYSPAGEDFFFTVAKRNFAEEVDQYADDFDADEHAEMWVECRNTVRGVPQSIRTLIDDADAIQEMLYSLARALNGRSY